ncbi:hypothetical protein DF947_08515 [Pedobacter paludis]|uniref:Uncharacterized protein n=1 Tax=Pedobacter paludis TaxID=2203212 RepID=A0A317EYA3_9SPHI|nr:hypothetical protein DF947_08515 [Pedobacter paludis]
MRAIANGGATVPEKYRTFHFQKNKNLVIIRHEATKELIVLNPKTIDMNSDRIKIALCLAMTSA